jgi:SYF2 splicing factor
MAEPATDSSEARLAALRQKLAKARSANILAVAEEGRVAERADSRDGPSSLSDTVRDEEVSDGDATATRRRSARKRARAEREPEDVVSKTLTRRINRARYADKADGGAGVGAESLGNDAVEPVVYGGAGMLKPGAAERVATELRDVDERNARARKPTPFDEDKEDIGFINEHNRRFNSVVDRMYGKHEAVKKIKDNLERGTALN